jgi:hypothetical protein
MDLLLVDFEARSLWKTISRIFERCHMDIIAFLVHLGEMSREGSCIVESELRNIPSLFRR